MKLTDIINHARNREYMGGVVRTKERIDLTGEVFTPTELVQEVLDKLPQELFDIGPTVLDNSCGDGQFLSEALIRKLSSYNKEDLTLDEFKAALANIYGVDLMIDNVDACRQRLLCSITDHDTIELVRNNIRQGNGLKFNYNFNPVTEAEFKREARLRAQAHKQRVQAEKKAAEQLRIANNAKWFRPVKPDK